MISLLPAQHDTDLDEARGQRRPTFVQMSLEFVELSLLETDLEVDGVIRRSRPNSRPLSRYVVCVLQCIRRTRLERRPIHGVHRNQGRQRQGASNSKQHLDNWRCGERVKCKKVQLTQT